ncbi:MAG: hypothetical protein ACYC9Y_15865 [Candidatus Methylomirabilia bacterium]
MEQVGAVRFDKSSVYTRAQIHESLGGSPWAALPTRGRKIVGVCLTREKNPRAPEEMVVGGADRALRLARAFAASGEAVPVFVRTRRGGWEYAGERRVRSLIEDPGALLALVAEGAPADIAAAMHLEEVPREALDAGGVAAGPRQPPTAPGA